jgi:WD40 repeat protein/uncharacterized caspase-like protein
VDCQGLAEALADATQGFAQKEVTIYHDFAPQISALENVRSSLHKIANAAKSQDTVLLYFSGHGMLEENTSEAFLCLVDTQKENLQTTGLAIKEILQLLGNCQAHQQLIWLDACHSGKMTLRNAAQAELLPNPTPQLVEVLQKRAAKSKGFYALLSCDQDQQSWEFPELGHGVFTYFLMRGLRGDAADSQGVISADGLYRYVYHQTLQYIDKTNQQLRLINQQKIAKGEAQLYPEYPLQTPKRIVEGVGELIIGKTPASLQATHQRIAVVVEGTTNPNTLAFSKILRGAGNFELEYLPRTGKTTAQDIRETIQQHLRINNIETFHGTSLQGEEPATVLLYLRGKIEEAATGEAVLLLGENIKLSRSWLRQQLRHSTIAQQIIILDCPQANSLQEWVEDLQLGSEKGQCIIAAASASENPEQFATALVDSLQAANPAGGLSVAGWITQLQVSLADAFPLHIWLSGARGVIEVIPPASVARSLEKTTLDLGICPYRGLQAFKEEDHQYYYGREALIQQLLIQCEQKPFVAVVGASGSGKSSLVQAGLIAQLRHGKQIPGSEKWTICTLQPGAHPLEALARRLGALEQGGGSSSLPCPLPPAPLPPVPSPSLILEGHLYQGLEGFVYWVRSQQTPMIILVIDQFEELFTLAPSEERERFLELVLGALEHAPDKFKLIITLRADFIAACLEVIPLARRLQESNFLVPPKLTEEDYRRVIVNPAEQVGLKVAPDLVQVLLQELNHSPGDLPLLEFVLEQLWEYRSAGELTLQAYQQQLGGIKGALERSCQEVYESLSPQEQECTRWIFLSLTQLGEGTEDTRRRVLKSDLIVQKYPIPLVEKTLSTLTAAKLVVMSVEEEEVGGQGAGSREQGAGSRGDKGDSMPHYPLPITHYPFVTVEVAHEVLIRHWSTLRWWLEENRARLRVQRQIEQAAMLWLQSEKQADFLLQGVRLAEAEDMYIKYTDELSANVQEFIAACLEARQRQKLQEKRRLQQAQRAAVVMGILGVAAFGFGCLAYLESRTAHLQEIETLNSLSENFLFSNKQLDALITSVKAGKHLQNMMWFGKATIPQIPQNIQTTTAAALRQALDETQERNRLVKHSAWVNSAIFSADGNFIASASGDKTIKLWRRDGTLIKTFTGHQKTVNYVSFAPDGKTLVSASDDNTIKLWRQNGELIATLTGHSDSVNTVIFSPQGDMFVSTSDDDRVKLWSTEGKLLTTLQGHSKGVNSATFSPNGEIIASASDDGTVKLWSTAGKLLLTLQGHQDEVISVSFSPDGQTLASTSHDRTIKLWNVKSGNLLKTLEGHTAWVMGVSFSPNGKIIASASADKTINLWTSDGTWLQTLPGHSNAVNTVIFSADGKTIASASEDSTIRLWDVDEIFPQTGRGHSGDVVNLAFSPDGSTIASASEDATIKLWSRDGKLLKTLTGHTNAVSNVSFSPDGDTLASSSGDRTIKLWSRDGKLINTLPEHNLWVLNVKFSPDGKTIASASADGTVKLWSRDGRILHSMSDESGWVTGLGFSPDGKTIAAGSLNGTVKLWSSEGKLVNTLKSHSGSVWSVSFSPDGKTIASASADHTIKLWRRDGSLRQTLTGHTDEVISISFSPDGKILASGSADNTIKLWNIEDGTLLTTVKGHQGHVRGISFSPDGKILASGSGDDTIKLWRLEGIELKTLDLNSLLVRGCRALHDYLLTNPKVTPQESQICAGKGTGD